MLFVRSNTIHCTLFHRPFQSQAVRLLYGDLYLEKPYSLLPNLLCVKRAHMPDLKHIEAEALEELLKANEMYCHHAFSQPFINQPLDSTRLVRYQT